MSTQFVLKFTKNDDLRLQLEDREDLLMLVRLRFANLHPNQDLKVYGIPQADLDSFMDQQIKIPALGSLFDSKNTKTTKLPEDKYFLKDESIMSLQQFKEEEKENRLPIQHFYNFGDDVVETEDDDKNFDGVFGEQFQMN